MAKKSKILVTGGAGFIGSHVSKHLMDLGYKVVIVDNFNDYYDPALKEARINQFLKGYNFKLYRIDITNNKALRKIFEENKINKICHLAAIAGVRYSLENPYIYEKTNILGTLNLLELAKEFKVKGFIYASSSSIYGNTQKKLLSENEIFRPISLYGATKATDELLAYTYHHLFGIPCTGLRYFTVYGPWGRPDMALYLFAKGIAKGRPIDVYNFGKMKRDFTYIDDIVDGTVAALEKNYDFEIFNLGAGRMVNLNYFIKLIEKELGKTAKKNLLPLQPGDVLSTLADIRKAKKMLGYNPKTSVEKGIKNFIQWFKEYEG